MKTINDYAELVKEKHALNKTIAPVEADETDASKAYQVGEQLIMSGILYDVIAPISVHDVITTTGSGANIAPAGPISAKIQTLTNEVDTIVNELGAKNILKNNASDYTSQGVSFVVNADKTVNVTSTPSTGTASVYLNTGFEIKAGTYKLSAMPKDFDGGYQKAQVYVQYRNSQNTWVDVGWDDKGVNNDGNEIHTFSEPTFIRVALVVYSGKTYDFVVKPMIYPSDIVNDDYVQFAMTNKELTENVLSTIPTKFIKISTAEISDSYNPITIAEELVATNSTEIVYVQVGANSNITNPQQYCPLQYTIYEIRHTGDTVTLNAIAYNPDLSNAIYTIGRSRNGSWGTWQRTTMSAVT